MHRRALLQFLASAAAFAAARGASAHPHRDGFHVHEWGTFTTFQGSEGGELEGLHHEEEPLPSFVHTVTSEQSGSAWVPAPASSPAPPRAAPSLLERAVDAVLPVPAAAPVFAPRPCGKGIPCEEIRRVTTKMETPVLYYYTDRPRRVRTKVEFVNGLLSQFYPKAKLDGFQPFAKPVVDLSEIPRTSLEWTLDLVPHGDRATPAVPAVEPGDPWQYAREVACASVKTTDGAEAERYVFYRGLGRLSLPLTVTALGRGRVNVRNAGPDAVAKLFLLEMTPAGGRFLDLGALAGGANVGGDLGPSPLRRREEVVEALRAQVRAALVSEGLFEDEAEAMVRTWSRTWFGSEGTRVLYLVPRVLTDRLLPLELDPKPQSLVRVLVGRLEFLTPETEAEAELAFAKRGSRHAPAARAAEERLARFGRFLEPVGRRVYEKTKDPAVRRAVAEALRR